MALSTGLFAFGEWRPDVASLNTKTSSIITNAVPRADGYGPFKDFVAFTSPLAEGNDSFTKVLLHFDGADASTTITDSNAGGSAHTWTTHGDAQIDTAQYEFGGASGLFDGTGDYVDTPDHADYTLATSDFTIDLGVRPNANGSLLYICGQCNSSGAANADSAWYISRTAANKIEFGIVSGTTVTKVTSTTSVTTGNWYHIAAVRTGNVLKLFINATQEGGNVSFSSTINNSTAVLAIGRAGAITTTEWNGWVDEFRLSVGTARWTSAFTAPQKSYDAAANGQCRGLFFARNTDGSITIFAATSTRLFKLNNTSFGWIDVSKGGLAYTAVPSGANWRFVQFNKYVIVVQVNTAPQLYDVSSSTVFADLGGSPPQASSIAVIGRFVVLIGISGSPYKVKWSGLNAVTTWTPGTSQSDEQDLSDGGRILDIAGGDQFGVIFQESSIRSMVYVPGSAVIFEILRIATNDGILTTGCAISAGDKIFFISPQGFKKIAPGGYPEPIGKEKVDRTFLADLDTANLQFLMAATDPNTTRVYWSYKSTTGQSGLFDKIIVHDWALDRTTVLEISGEFLAGLAHPGLTLENLDSISSSIDALPFSLDSISVAALAQLAAVGPTHAAGFFTGSNLEAIMETPQEDGNGKRIFIDSVRPMTDCDQAMISIGCLETAQQASATYTAESEVDDTGECSIDGGGIDTRYAKVRIRCPAGSSWSYAMGVEPSFKFTGVR